MNMRRPGLTFLLGLAVAGQIGDVWPVQAQPAHLCWIKHVARTSAGVDIYFDRDRTRVARRGVWETMTEASIAGEPETYPHVEAKLGDELALTNTVEDGCTVTVDVQGGAIGVRASAYANPPGLPHATSDEFIPAVAGGMIGVVK